MKKRNIKRSKVTTIVLFVAATALLLTGVVGGTYAALTYFSETYRADVDMKSIGVTLLENNQAVSWRDYTHADDVWNESTGSLLANMLGEEEQIEYGKEYPEVLTAKNSGTIDEYVRVRVYKYWEDENGNKLTDLDPAYIRLDVSGENWIENEAERTEERTVLYYRPILKSGDVTSAFNQTLSIDASISGEVFESVSRDENGFEVLEMVYVYDGARFVVKAEVDAVQTHNAADAFKSAWGVTATFDANGNVATLK